MTCRRSLLAVCRFVLVVFTLLFIKDAFYYWDGYAFYMYFSEFLPELCLVFVIWTICSVLISLLIWLLIYIVSVLLRTFSSASIEHIMIFFLFVWLILFIKRSFWGDVSLSDVFGADHIVVLASGGLIVMFFVWIIRGFCTRIVEGINDRITPLAWIFAFVFMISVPVSFAMKSSSETNNRSDVYLEDHVKEQPRADESLKRPNIVLVVMDTLTSLDMGLYGYERETTPFISEWAGDAAVFSKLYASSNWTTPTVMSIMTGQRPWTHKTWYQVVYKPADRYEDNFPRVLRDNGYDIYGYVQNRFAHPDFLGLHDYFSVNDKYYTFMDKRSWWFDKLKKLVINRPVAYTWFFTENNLISKQIKRIRPDLPLTIVPADNVYNRFLEDIAGFRSLSEERSDKQDKPFFAWLHVVPPHDPYLPPEPFMGSFGDASASDTQHKQDAMAAAGEYKPEDQATVDIMRKRYDEFILYSDHQFKEFVTRLAGTVDMSNTIIILTSDHGESFLHGFYRHGPHGSHLYEQLVNVPLVIKMNDKADGMVLNTPVEQIDLAPTILEFAGIEGPQWMEGRPLTPLIEGGRFEPKPVFSMSLVKNSILGDTITKGAIAVWDGDFKLIDYLDEDRQLLFNLRDDPGEENNLANKKTGIVRHLKKLIDDNLEDANKRISESK